ncbi:hypothetical protein PI125_g21470 [Phytophthora idaei]|nr:hypothetical protein PI125_g21470 [Phytophthora idaei]
MHTSGDADGHDAVGRESAHDTSSALLNGVTTLTAAKTAAQGVRTRAATRAAASLTSGSPAPSVAARATPANITRSAHQGRAATRAAPRAITDWTTRTLIDPGLQRRHISGRERQDAVDPAASSLAKFEPNPESQQRDAAAVHDFVGKRESVARYRGRKNLEKFAVGDRVLLSTAGIQPSLVTNLGTSKLAPRYIGPFKVTKVLGDAYTLRLPSTIRLHPTFCVGRLRRYHPAVIPSDAGATRQRSLDHPAAARDAPPLPAAVPGDAAQHYHAPPGPSAGQDDPEAARSQLPPCGLGSPFQRDGPTPLVDRAGNARYIVEAILQHDDIRAAPPQGRGVHHRDGDVPPHREYLVRWLGPMPDSWEPRAVLVADVPDCMAAYEASLVSGAGSPRAKKLEAPARID